MCSFDESWKNILSCCCLMLIAFIYVYLSTYVKLNFKGVKQVQRASNIKWYHILYGVIISSLFIIAIYLFRKYISIILYILIGIESWFCAYYAIVFFIIQIGKNICSTNKHMELSHKKCKKLFNINTYDIISAIITSFLIIFYFITRHWILNDIICFCLSFTILAFIILKSFMLCFICLFAFLCMIPFGFFFLKKYLKIM